jgi:hypothetical protein
VSLPLWLFLISCCSPLLAFFLSLHFHHGQEQQTQARADSSVRGLRRLGILRGGVLLYSEEEFSSESEGSPAPVSPPASSDDSDDSQGIAAEVWTYIRAVERSGLEGSDESEYSSDEEDSDDGGEDEDGDDDDDDGDNDSSGGGRGGNSGSGGSNSGSRSGNGGSSRGSNKASG